MFGGAVFWASTFPGTKQLSTWYLWMIFYSGSIKSWRVNPLHSVISTFSGASGLVMNKSKSCLIHGDSDETVITGICSLFDLGSSHFEHGFVYLGFRIKTNNYHLQDWDWLIDWFEKRFWRVETKVVIDGRSPYFDKIRAPKHCSIMDAPIPINYGGHTQHWVYNGQVHVVWKYESGENPPCLMESSLQ